MGWSSNAREKTIGAEYIIMEKVAGVQLDKVRSNMDINDRFEIVQAISGYQKALMSTSFARYGSLYYSSDLDDSDGCVLEREWNWGQRASLRCRPISLMTVESHLTLTEVLVSCPTWSTKATCSLVLSRE